MAQVNLYRLHRPVYLPLRLHIHCLTRFEVGQLYLLIFSVNGFSLSLKKVLA